MEIFTYQTYKSALRGQIRANQAVKGYKSKLAEAAGCQRAYLSHVLKTHVQLTPEHALGIAHFWGLGPLEKDYFLELVNRERAGTLSLRKYCEERLAEMRLQNANLSARLKRPGIGEQKLQTLYYSSWHYSAIHILLTIPGFQTTKAISNHLRLSEELVREALITLKEMGLAEQAGLVWKASSFDIHLAKDSPMNSINHSNWRGRAVLDSQVKSSTGTHFTGVYSMSQEDLERLKAELIKFVELTRKTALASAEEKVVAFNCDLFEV